MQNFLLIVGISAGIILFLFSAAKIYLLLKVNTFSSLPRISFNIFLTYLIASVVSVIFFSYSYSSVPELDTAKRLQLKIEQIEQQIAEIQGRSQKLQDEIQRVQQRALANGKRIKQLKIETKVEGLSKALQNGTFLNLITETQQQLSNLGQLKKLKSNTDKQIGELSVSTELFRREYLKWELSGSNDLEGGLLEEQIISKMAELSSFAINYDFSPKSNISTEHTWRFAMQAELD